MVLNPNAGVIIIGMKMKRLLFVIALVLSGCSVSGRISSSSSRVPTADNSQLKYYIVCYSEGVEFFHGYSTNVIIPTRQTGDRLNSGVCVIYN